MWVLIFELGSIGGAFTVLLTTELPLQPPPFNLFNNLALKEIEIISKWLLLFVLAMRNPVLKEKYDYIFDIYDHIVPSI